MKKVLFIGMTVVTTLVLFSCKKEKTPIKTYEVTLDLQPNNSDSWALADQKTVFLSFSEKRGFPINQLPGNYAKIDLAVYDGTTTSTSIGNVHFVAIGGGTISLKTGASQYLYKPTDGSSGSVKFYDLFEMDSWGTYNSTIIRDETGLNGMTVKDFMKCETVEDYDAILAKIQQPGTNNGNSAKRLINTTENELSSELFYFEYYSDGGVKKTAIARVLEYNHTVGNRTGWVKMQIKQPD